MSFISLTVMAGCASTGSQTFRHLDSNHDGRLTEAEFYEHFTDEGFRQLDTNRDGKITLHEWLAKEPATVEMFDTRTGTLKDKVLSFAIHDGEPSWAKGMGD